MPTPESFSVSQKGFVTIILILVLVGLVVLGGFYFFRMENMGATLNNSNNSQPKISQSENQPSPFTFVEKKTCSAFAQTVEVARETADGAFTSSVTDIDKIAVISSGKLVGDSRFTYLWIKDKQRVPIFAPADGTLVKISYKTRVDLPPGMSMPDYDLTFLVDCHTMYRINHITDPNAEIANLKPITAAAQLGKGLPAISDDDSNPKANIMVKAGQQIGSTTGTPAAHNFDFGIFIDQVSVCPYEKFNEPVRSDWLALIGDTSKPIKGTACEVSGNF